MNKDEKNAKLAQIAKRVEDHGIKMRNQVIFDSLREAWNSGYNDGYSDCHEDEKVVAEDGDYKRGQNDAWEIAKRIVLGEEDGGLSYDELAEIFELGNYKNILLTFSAQECREKIAAYDATTNDIKIGDFVNVINKLRKGVVVEKVTPNGVKVLFSDGKHDIVSDRYCSKVGCLQDMEGNNENR